MLGLDIHRNGGIVLLSVRKEDIRAGIAFMFFLVWIWNGRARISGDFVTEFCENRIQFLKKHIRSNSFTKCILPLPYYIGCIHLFNLWIYKTQKYLVHLFHFVVILISCTSSFVNQFIFVCINPTCFAHRGKIYKLLWLLKYI